jgi:hypothetical protein
MDMLSADVSPVLDSKGEGLVESSVWLVLYSVLVFICSDVLKSVHAVLKGKDIPLSVSVLSDETDCEGDSLACSMVGRIVVKDSFSSETDIGVIACLKVLFFMPSTDPSKETEVVCGILENWVLLELGIEGVTDFGITYNLVGFGSLEIVTMEAETEEGVLYLSALAETGECEGASSGVLVELVGMDPSQTELVLNVVAGLMLVELTMDSESVNVCVPLCWVSVFEEVVDRSLEVTMFDVTTVCSLWLVAVCSDSVVVVDLEYLVEIPVEVSSDIEWCNLERNVLPADISFATDVTRERVVGTLVWLILCSFVECMSSYLLELFHAFIKEESVGFPISAVVKEIDCGDESVVSSDLARIVVKYSCSDEIGVGIMVCLSLGVELPFFLFPFVTEETEVICEILDTCAMLKLF